MADFREFKSAYVGNLTQAVERLDGAGIELLCAKLTEAYREGNTVFLLGNGGSAATPSHSAGDWAKCLGLRSVCLTDNTPFVTAVSNDEDYEEIFLQQLRVFLGAGDVVIAYSGSGNSPNVINAIEFAKSKGNFTVGITGNYKGKAGGKLATLADLPIVVESESMEVIEDVHLVINHIVKEYLRGNGLSPA